MSLTARFVPDPFLHQVDHVAVAADPDHAWQAIRRFDGYRLPVVRALFGLRQLPDVLRAKLTGDEAPLRTHATIDDLVAPGSGFHLLDEVSGRGFAVGAIGRFWLPVIEFRDVDPHLFSGFSEPGFGKVCWSLEAAPREGGGSWISLDVRVDGTDAHARALFRPYWKLIGVFSHAIRRAVMKQFQAELGEPREERVLPGDELLHEVRYERTHHAVLEAPRDEVWPWLVQMGCQRAGWYALDLLDNGGRPSAEHIEAKWQQLSPGDLVPATPDGSAAFGVLEMEYQHVLVLGSPSLRASGPDAPGAEPPYRMTWSFVLEPVGDDATSLTVRVRAEYEPTVDFFLRHAWTFPAHELMTQQQLKHLKARVEGPALA